MPTENRSTMVSVPPYIGLEPLVGLYYPALCRRCGWVGSSEELTEDDAQCTRDVGDRLCLGDCDELGRDDLLGIIQAMAHPAQHQGEPYGWAHDDGKEFTTHADYASDLEKEGIAMTPLYTHPAPADHQEPTYQKPQDYWDGFGYVDYSCAIELRKAVSHLERQLDAVPDGPLYENAAPGEVERLRAMFDKTDADLRTVTEERDKLLAQVDTLAEWYGNALNKLAERDALLREVEPAYRAPGLVPMATLINKIDVALSASAEPINDLCAEGAHEFVPFSKICVKCDEPYSAEQSAPVESGPWQPLSAPGQVQDGDWLSFTVAGHFICAQARQVIDPGTDKEEIVYNRQKNHYFVTSMAVNGSSTHKGVRVAKAKS